MSTDRLINLIASITLIEMMLTIGLGVTMRDLAGVVRNWRLLTRAAVVNYLLVPAAAVALLLLFRASPLVAAGFLVVAVCPGAPYGPPFTSLAKGNVVAAVGLMAVLAGSSAFVAPALLRLLLPMMAGDQDLRVNAGRMIAALAVSQFLPLCVGLFVRHRYPAAADRAAPTAARISVALNLLLVATILALQFPLLMQIRLAGYGGMVVLLAVTFALGLAAGAGDTAEGRKALAITTGVRNAGVAVVIATASFPGTTAITATVAYALVQTVGMALLATGWGRTGPGRRPRRHRMTPSPVG